MPKSGTLLFIIEQGGYPVNLFEKHLKLQGYDVIIETSMRKALALLKKTTPDIIVAEFNYVSQFRDRVSNLDTLLAILQSRMPDTRIVVFLDKEENNHLDELRECYTIDKALFYPLEMEIFVDSIGQLSGSAGVNNEK